VLVSKQEHCLYDLLARWQAKELDIEIPCVISNHDTFRGFVEWHGIPFLHVPVCATTSRRPTPRSSAFSTTCAAIRWSSPATCRSFARTVRRAAGKIINIHHSFLPSFAGAKPYHQAYARGVKLIGATCHYVTSELDAGPIIEQDVIRIDHSDSPDDMVRYGKDIEKTVLARGLRYHLEDRVLVHGNKTVVFR
jgi:formyltetrahydrofolate deformylase